jgi:hypothetical protein
VPLAAFAVEHPFHGMNMDGNLQSFSTAQVLLLLPLLPSCCCWLLVNTARLLLGRRGPPASHSAQHTAYRTSTPLLSKLALATPLPQPKQFIYITLCLPMCDDCNRCTTSDTMR